MAASQLYRVSEHPIPPQTTQMKQGAETCLRLLPKGPKVFPTEGGGTAEACQGMPRKRKIRCACQARVSPSKLRGCGTHRRTVVQAASIFLSACRFGCIGSSARRLFSARRVKSLHHQRCRLSGSTWEGRPGAGRGKEPALLTLLTGRQ